MLGSFCSYLHFGGTSSLLILDLCTDTYSGCSGKVLESDTIGTNTVPWPFITGALAAAVVLTSGV